MRDPREFPDLDPTSPTGPRAQVPLCTSSHGSVGCNHPTSWHTGPDTIAPGCDCCSWRQNDPGHVPAERALPLHEPLPGYSQAKWDSMPRRERRAAERAARRRA